MKLTEDDVKRFESKYQRGEENECWEWQGQRAPKGGGTFSLRRPEVERKTYSASRLSWSLANGSEIPPGKMICHHCDNPPCVNPRHLYLGTGFDNNSDTVKRCRAVRVVGESCSWSKLTEKDVEEIRNSPYSQAHLAKKFGVSQSHISRIKSGSRNLWAGVGS